MKLNIICLISAFILFLSGCDDPSSPSNQSPVISSIEVFPEHQKINQQVKITCIADDAEDDSLFYNWQVSAGEIISGNNTSEILFATPDIPGNLTVSVKVSDEEFSVSDSIILNINDNIPPTVPSNPFPLNNSIIEDETVTLIWNSNDEDDVSITYDVYFGLTPEPQLIAENISDTTYSIKNLFRNGQYYWKIVAKDEDSEVAGNIWTFTTTPAVPNFEFVDVNAGNYTYGKNNEILSIEYSFKMMKYEVTNQQYIEFLNTVLQSSAIKVTSNSVTGYFPGNSKWPAGEYEIYDLDEKLPGYNVRNIIWDGESFSIDIEYEKHPVVLVSWFGAYIFAQYYGLSLPTEYEWEKTARAETGWVYPWGNSITGNDANFWNSNDPWERGTTPIGYYNGENGMNDRPTQYGAYDMIGNVWEWTSSNWTDESKYYVMRGGSWNINGTNFYLKSFSRDTNLPDFSNHYIGFRCLQRIE